MPIAEWEHLSVLVSLEGNLTLNDRGNAEGFGYYLTAKDQAKAVSDVRSTGDPVPQGGGTIWHRGFDNGYVVEVPIHYWVDEATPASFRTTPTAQEMDDRLMRHLRSILSGGGRILYAPQGQPVRLLDQLQCTAGVPLIEGDAVTGVVVTLASVFPYLQDFDQTLTTIDSGTPTATLDNTGSAPYFPVFKVSGPFSAFELTNVTTGLKIVYDAGQPGAVSVAGGDYIEITTFHNTVYLNGDGASRKAGIVIAESDFFTLDPGDNLIATGGADTPTVDILWAPAWW